MKTGAYRSWVGGRQNDIRTMTDGTVFLFAITVKKVVPGSAHTADFSGKTLLPGARKYACQGIGKRAMTGKFLHLSLCHRGCGLFGGQVQMTRSAWHGHHTVSEELS
jgi:hypothetical protein